MEHSLRWYRTFTATLVAILIATSIFCVSALAGTTGTVTGTVTDGQGNPIAGVRVTASSPSQKASTTTNPKGFYAIQQLGPDMYTISFQAQGYDAVTVPGTAVFQDQNEIVNARLTKSLKTIANVEAKAANNLVQGYTGTDVYNVSGSQLNAAFGGDNTQKTLYQYLAVVPGVAGRGGGYPAEPSIRGGQDTDNGYEFDGVPIVDRSLGFFTTNLSNTGIGNVEVYTGGLNAGAAANGTGIINSVVKTGTYPGFAIASFALQGPQFMHQLHLEYGGATPNNRFSWYAAFDGNNSENEYNDSSHTYPYVQFGFAGASFSNPGPVATRDLVANFFYRPSKRNDFQFLFENSQYAEQADYLLHNPLNPMLMVNPCPGYVPSTTTASGADGGTAPNGAPCTGSGLYFSPVSAYWAVYTSHAGGIGKLQWNHIINDHSSFAVRLSENFNQYIFSQPVSDINNAAFENSPSNINTLAPGVPALNLPGCPALPYAPYAPVPIGYNPSTNAAGFTPALCTHFVGDYYQDRNSRMYNGSFDYTNQPNADLTIKAGFGQEYDQNLRAVYNLEAFNSPTFEPQGGMWPLATSYTDVPSHIPYAYVQASVNIKRFTLEPGIRYQREYYEIPKRPIDPNDPTKGTTSAPVSVGAFIPTFAGTYRMSPNDVLRYSWGQTASFVGTAYVYRTGNSFYTPQNPGTSFAPQINRSTDLMYEHQLKNNTSLRFGPWERATDNYIEEYNPITGYKPDGSPIFSKVDAIFNGLRIRARGLELGLNHTDNRPSGISYWLAASYDNYWTTAVSLNSGFYNAPLPSNIASTTYIRSAVPLIEATLTADLHTHDWHFLPFVTYSGDNFFNVGVTTSCSVPGADNGAPYPGCGAGGVGNLVPTYIYQPEQISRAYFWSNATLLKNFGENRAYTIGIRGINLTNNQANVTPCAVYTDGTGCYPLIGPQTGYSGLRPSTISNPSYIYQNASTTPVTWEFFLTKRW